MLSSLLFTSFLLLPSDDAVEPDAGRSVVVYKTEPRDLEYEVFLPAEDSSDKRGGVVFFHGGAWIGGSRGQFATHCEEIARRGGVGITVTYRLRSTDGTPATACVTDAFDAWCHVLEHAEDYGLDPARLAVGGGSAGGHIAACLGTGTVPPGYDAAGLQKPRAMVLFNPGVCLGSFEGYEPIKFEDTTAARVGCEPKLLSPMHHLDKDTPATLIMHGTADTTISIQSAALFVQRLQQFGTTGELKRYPGAKHGFFNRGEAYDQTMQQMLTFLAEQNVLTPEN